MMHDNMLDYPEGELTQAAMSMEDIRQVTSQLSINMFCTRNTWNFINNLDTLISYLRSFCSYIIAL